MCSGSSTMSVRGFELSTHAGEQPGAPSTTLGFLRYEAIYAECRQLSETNTPAYCAFYLGINSLLWLWLTLAVRCRPVPAETRTLADSALRLVQKSKQSGTDPGSSEWTLQCQKVEACISPAAVAALRALLGVWSRSSSEAALAPQGAGMWKLGSM